MSCTELAVGDIGRHVASRVREVRHRRGLTQAALGRLAGIDASAISKIEAAADEERETPRRGVSVEDLLALAYALNVSPLDLMLPNDDLEKVALAPGAEWEAHLVRSWVTGDLNLPPDPETLEAYIAETPPSKQRHHRSWRHPAASRLIELQVFVRDAVLGDRLNQGMTPQDLAATLRDRAQLLTQYLELLADELERQETEGQA